jgi:hypothetical protein
VLGLVGANWAWAGALRLVGPISLHHTRQIRAVRSTLIGHIDAALLGAVGGDLGEPVGHLPVRAMSVDQQDERVATPRLPHRFASALIEASYGIHVFIAVVTRPVRPHLGVRCAGLRAAGGSHAMDSITFTIVLLAFVVFLVVMVFLISWWIINY